MSCLNDAAAPSMAPSAYLGARNSSSETSFSLSFFVICTWFRGFNFRAFFGELSTVSALMATAHNFGVMLCNQKLFVAVRWLIRRTSSTATEIGDSLCVVSPSYHVDTILDSPN